MRCQVSGVGGGASGDLAHRPEAARIVGNELDSLIRE